jgi:hypothetical protein
LAIYLVVGFLDKIVIPFLVFGDTQGTQTTAKDKIAIQLR